MKENLIVIKKFLFKWFFVGVLFFVLSAVLFIFFKDWGAEIAQKWYGIEPAFYYNIAGTLLGIVKIYLFFFVLAPAIALHWLIGCCKCKKKEEE